MKNARKSKLNSSGGFTLVELVIVMIIIGILATFGLRTYFKNIETARINEAMTALSRDAGQLESQYAKNGSWPATTAFTACSSPVDGFTCAYPAAAPNLTATRASGDYSGSVLTFARGGDSSKPTTWCWRWVGAGGIAVADTPIAASKCCNAACN